MAEIATLTALVSTSEFNRRLVHDLVKAIDLATHGLRRWQQETTSHPNLDPQYFLFQDQDTKYSYNLQASLRELHTLLDRYSADINGYLPKLDLSRNLTDQNVLKDIRDNLFHLETTILTEFEPTTPGEIAENLSSPTPKESSSQTHLSWREQVDSFQKTRDAVIQQTHQLLMRELSALPQDTIKLYFKENGTLLQKTAWLMALQNQGQSVDLIALKTFATLERDIGTKAYLLRTSPEFQGQVAAAGAQPQTLSSAPLGPTTVHFENTVTQALLNHGVPKDQAISQARQVTNLIKATVLTGNPAQTPEELEKVFNHAVIPLDKTTREVIRQNSDLAHATQAQYAAQEVYQNLKYQTPNQDQVSQLAKQLTPHLQNAGVPPAQLADQADHWAQVLVTNSQLGDTQGDPAAQNQVLQIALGERFTQPAQLKNLLNDQNFRTSLNTLFTPTPIAHINLAIAPTAHPNFTHTAQVAQELDNLGVRNFWSRTALGDPTRAQSFIDWYSTNNDQQASSLSQSLQSPTKTIRLWRQLSQRELPFLDQSLRFDPATQTLAGQGIGTRTPTGFFGRLRTFFFPPSFSPVNFEGVSAPSISTQPSGGFLRFLRAPFEGLKSLFGSGATGGEGIAQGTGLFSRLGGGLGNFGGMLKNGFGGLGSQALQGLGGLAGRLGIGSAAGASTGAAGTAAAGGAVVTIGGWVAIIAVVIVIILLLYLGLSSTSPQGIAMSHIVPVGGRGGVYDGYVAIICQPGSAGCPALSCPDCQWPVTCGSVTQCPGGGFSHRRLNAIDFGLASCGITQRGAYYTLPYPGTVTDYVMNYRDGYDNGGYGNYVDISFTDPDSGRVFILKFAHLSYQPGIINKGDNIPRSDGNNLIGYVDDTGFSTATHLHYELRAADGGGVPSIASLTPGTICH